MEKFMNLIKKRLNDYTKFKKAFVYCNDCNYDFNKKKYE